VAVDARLLARRLTLPRTVAMTDRWAVALPLDDLGQMVEVVRGAGRTSGLAYTSLYTMNWITL
jgi:hypothetical protein